MGTRRYWSLLGSTLMLTAFLYALFTYSSVQAMLPPYCPEGIFIKNNNFDQLLTTLDSIYPFKNWKIRHIPKNGDRDCADAGYMRPIFSYQYKSNQTGVTYEILFMLTIPVNRETGIIGYPNSYDLKELIMDARITDEAILDTEKYNQLNGLIQGGPIVGKVVVSSFPEVLIYRQEPKYDYSNYYGLDKGVIYRHKYAKWESLPNQEYNAELDRIGLELLTRTPITNSDYKLIIIFAIAVLAIVQIIFFVRKPIRKI